MTGASFKNWGEAERKSTVGFIHRPTSAMRGVLVEARALGLRAN